MKTSASLALTGLFISVLTGIKAYLLADKEEKLEVRTARLFNSDFYDKVANISFWVFIPATLWWIWS